MCTADLAPDDDMAYDAQALTDLVHRRLKAVPLTSLASIADAAGADRHTIVRALMVVEGRTFRQIQTDAIRNVAARIRRGDPFAAVKAVALEIGYRNPGSMARRIGHSRR